MEQDEMLLKDMDDVFTGLGRYGLYEKRYREDGEMVICLSDDPTIHVRQYMGSKRPQYSVYVHYNYEHDRDYSPKIAGYDQLSDDDKYSLTDVLYLSSDTGIRLPKTIHQRVMEIAERKKKNRDKLSLRALHVLTTLETSQGVTLRDLAEKYSNSQLRWGLKEKNKVFLSDFLSMKQQRASSLSLKELPMTFADIPISPGQVIDLTWEIGWWFENLEKRAGSLVASFALEAINDFVEWARKARYNDSFNPFGRTFPGLSNRFPESSEKREISQRFAGTMVFFRIPPGGLTKAVRGFSNEPDRYPFQWGIGTIARCHLSENWYPEANIYTVPKDYMREEDFSFELRFYPLGSSEDGALTVTDDSYELHIPASWITHEIRFSDFPEPYDDEVMSDLWQNDETRCKYTAITWEELDFDNWSPERLHRRDFRPVNNYRLYKVLYYRGSNAGIPFDTEALPYQNYVKNLIGAKLYKNEQESMRKICETLRKHLEVRKARAEEITGKKYDLSECLKLVPQYSVKVQSYRPHGSSETKPSPDIKEVRENIDKHGYPATAKIYGVKIGTVRKWSKDHPGKGILSAG